MAVDCYAGCYLLSKIDRGSAYSLDQHACLCSYMNVPFKEDCFVAFSDANWGPQDEYNKSTVPMEIPIEKLCSMSGFVFMCTGGPITWGTQEQDDTAMSICEVDVVTTNACCKELLHLHNISDKFQCCESIPPTPLYNDNCACVDWCKDSTTKGMRHLNVKKNFVCNHHCWGDVHVTHIPGKLNVSNEFTK
eukprot:8224437-Ditylum_brightwellii.AAC.1